MIRKSARLAEQPVKSYSKANKKTITKKIKKSSINIKKEFKKTKSGSDILNTKTSVKNELESIIKESTSSGDVSTTTTMMASDTANIITAAVLPRKYDVEKAWHHIKSVDAKLAKVMDDRAFKEFQQRIKLADGSNPFKSLVTSIIFQQIHGKAAASIRNRFLRSFESPIPFPADEILPSSFPWFPTPDMILAKTTEELRSVGLSQRKTEYIQDLSAKFANNTIVSEELDRMSDETISKLLCSVKGIGQWTVDMFLMFNLCHPDVLPVSDLGVRKGVALHFNTGNKKDKKNQIILPSPDEMRQLTEKWKPYRTLGSWMMWRLMEIKTVADD